MGFAGGFFLGSAFALSCWLIVAGSTSKLAKQKKNKQTIFPNKFPLTQIRHSGKSSFNCNRSMVAWIQIPADTPSTQTNLSRTTNPSISFSASVDEMFSWRS
jgi:hypothetical protein